MMTKILIIQAR